VTCSERSLPEILVIGEPQHVVVAVTQAFQQVSAWALLAPGHPLHLGEAEDDTVPERVHQRPGDLIGDRGQALTAGAAGRVDQALQRLGDLDGPVRAGVFLRNGGKITKQVLAAKLVDQAGDGVVVLVPVVHPTVPARSGSTNASKVFMLRSPRK